jgi:hypothetical protein
MTDLDQNLLFATAAIVLGGTLVVFVWQWWRGRGGDDD